MQSAKVIKATTGVMSVVASACLLFMMLIVVLDVVLRAINPEWRIYGMLDYVEYSMDWLVFLAIPFSLFMGNLICVDIMDTFDQRGWLKIFGAVITLIVLVVVGTNIINPALEILEWEERTLDLGILKFYYWIAIWVGIALSIVAALVQLIKILGTHK